MSYKQKSVDMMKYMEYMKALEYTHQEEHAEPTYRVDYKKRDSNFDDYDKSVQNWEENKKKPFNIVLLHWTQEMEDFLQWSKVWTETKW